MPTCIQCGAKVETGAAECRACGLPTPSAPFAPPQAPAAPSAPIPVVPKAPEVHPPGPMRSSLIPSIIATVIVLALVTVWAYFAFVAGSAGEVPPHPVSVTVPSVIEKSLDDARVELEATGFTIKTVEKDDAAAKGTVLAQSPEGGSTTKAGAEVELTISTGLDLVSVPDAVRAAVEHDYSGGDIEAEVRDVVEGVLKDRGLKAKVVFGPSGEPNYQKPKSGTRVQRGSTVTVHLAIGD